jgi:hypothetical protein
MIFYSGKTKYTSPRVFWELFSDPELAKQCFTDPIYLLELRAIKKDIDLRNRYHSGIVLSLMRAIHSKDIDILQHLYVLQPIICEIVKMICTKQRICYATYYVTWKAKIRN